MKVRVTFTVEVDPEKWAFEYGIDKAEVRRDINAYAEDALQQHVENLGLGVEKP